MSGIQADREHGRWLCDGRTCAVQREIIDAEVPAGGARLGETEANFGLTRGLREREVFDALRLDGIIIHAAADERAEGGPRLGGGANESAEGATFLLARFRIYIRGRVTMGLNQGGFSIGSALGIENDIGPVDHVDDRQPSSAFVDGVLNGTDAVLILFVDAVVVQMDVVDAGKIKVRAEKILHLASAANIGFGVETIAIDERLHALVVDVLFSHIQTAR